MTEGHGSGEEFVQNEVSLGFNGEGHAKMHQGPEADNGNVP